MQKGRTHRPFEYSPAAPFSLERSYLMMRSFPRPLIPLVAATATAILAAGVAALPASGAGTAPSAAQLNAQKVGTDAYVYGMSLMEFLRQAQTQTSVTVPNSLSDAPVNQLGSARNLNDATHHSFSRTTTRCTRWVTSI